MNFQCEQRVFVSMETKLNTLGKFDKSVEEASVKDTGRNNKNLEG